jgi:hypothetical protein
VFRRRKQTPSDEGGPEVPGAEAAAEGEVDAGSQADAGAEEVPASKADRPDGPWDVTELDLDDPDAPSRIDLGSLLVRGAEGMQLQLQLDRETDRVSAVMVVEEDSAVQLLAVAAPRSEGRWDEIRSELAADARSRGATVEEGSGPLGRELRVLLPIRLPDGQEAVQPSRVIGVDGPRWLLQATFLGRATQDPAAFARLADVVRDTVVVRGDAPMAPGDLLPLRLPLGAEPVASGAEDPPSRPTLDDLDPGPTATEIR